MSVGKFIAYFLLYLLLFVVGGLALWSALMWLVGEEQLFSIPLVYPIFKACPFVFLGFSYSLAQRKISQAALEESPSTRDSRQGHISEENSNDGSYDESGKSYKPFLLGSVFGGILVASIFLLWGQQVEEMPDTEDIGAESERLELTERQSVGVDKTPQFVEGDPRNIPYQKYVEAKLNRLDAGDLYGGEREAAIQLIRRYAKECENAGVEMFNYVRIEEEQFLRSVYRDPKQWKILRPQEWEEWEKYNVWRYSASSEKVAALGLKEMLNKKYVAWATRTPIGEVIVEWDEKRTQYLEAEHGITYQLSEEGLFRLIRDELKLDAQ